MQIKKGLGFPNKYFATQNKQMYTSALLVGAMKPLKVLSKFENHFVIKTVYFQVSLDAGGYFFAQEVFEFAIATLYCAKVTATILVTTIYP